MKKFLYSFRKNPLLLLLLFLQIAVTTYSIFYFSYYYKLYDYHSSQMNTVFTQYRFRTVLDNFFKQEAVEVFYNPYSGSDETLRAMGKFFEEVKNIDGLNVVPNLGGLHSSSISLAGSFDQIGEKDRSFPSPFAETHTEDDGSVTTEFQMNIIGSNYGDYFPLNVIEGRKFEQGDFVSWDDLSRIPVILGYRYKEYLNVGDILEMTSSFTIQDKLTLEVVGFLAENSVYPTSTGTSLRSFDDEIILPIPDMTSEIYENRRLTLAERQIIIGSYYLVDLSREDEIVAQIESLIRDNGLEEYLQVFPAEKLPEGETEGTVFANNYSSNLNLRLFAAVTGAVFSLVSIVFMSVNLVSERIKTYSIYMLTGSTTGGILLRVLGQISSVFLLGGIVGLFYYCVFPIFWEPSSFFNSTAKLYEDGYNFALSVGTLFVMAFFIFSLIFSSVSVLIKLKSYNLSMLIRNKDARKTKRRQPAYKIVLCVMLAFISIFTVYISSFATTAESSDMYYRHFYTVNTEMVSMSKMPGAGKFDTFDYPSLGENFSFHMIIGDTSPDSRSMARGVYYKGNMDLPNIIEGRFFTEEEMRSEEYICVAGQKAYNEWTETDENGEKVVRYSGKNYKVIGVMGKNENETTWLDYYTFIPMGTALKEYSTGSNFIIDANTRSEVEELTEKLSFLVSQKAIISHTPYSATEVAPEVTDSFILMIVIALLNCIVFALYYVDKTKYQTFVKKFIGYTKTMVFIDTLKSFLGIAAIAFVSGNVIMYALATTVFSEMEILKYYRIDIGVITISFLVITALCCIFTIFSLIRTYRNDTSELLR